MAITFPSNPSDGDTFTWGGVRYTFDSTPGAWVGSGGSDPIILYGTTFPNNGLEGELFYYEGSTSGDPARLYVYNGGVWVDAAPAAVAPPISDDSISEVKLQVSNSPVNGYMLTAQSGNTGGLTWAAPAGGGLGGNATAPVLQGTGSSITTTAAGLYYFRGSQTGTGTSGTATVSGSTTSGMIWGLSNSSSGPSFPVSVVTSIGGSMSVGVNRSTNSAPATGFGGWAETYGNTTFGGSSVSFSVYKVG